MKYARTIAYTTKTACMALLVVLLATAVLPHDAHALTRQQLNVEILNDFVLEPTKHEVLLDPGQQVTRSISVVNRTERPITFTIDIEDIVGSDNPFDQVKLLGDERGPYSLKDFLLPEVREFTVATGERVTVPVTVALPADAEPRGYYGSVIISARDQEVEGEATTGASGVTKLVTRLGSLFLVRVNGPLEEGSQLELFKPTDAGVIFSSHPESFEIAVRNTGNVHLVHFGQVTITNLLGREVARLPVDAFFSLPDTLRYREVAWPDSFSLGWYTATLELYQGYGPVEESMHVSTLSFWVLPWHIMLPVLLLVTLLIWFIIFFKKNFRLARK